MSEQPGLTREGLQNPRPDRDALTGAQGPRDAARRDGRRRGKGGRGEQPMVPDAKFTSYYGNAIINPPVWEPLDIAGYLFLGGLAGASSGLGLGAQLTGRAEMARISKATALGAISLGAVGLVHDLGRPERFTNMLRVFKPTSPMSVGSWLLAAYSPAAGVALLTDLTGRFPRIGTVASASAAVLGTGVASYTAALIADTSVPAWKEGYRELPFLFVASAANAAGGAALAFSPLRTNTPARIAAIGGAAVEISAAQVIKHRLGVVAEPYKTGKGGRLMKAAEITTAAGAAVTLAMGGRSRVAATVGGLAFLTGSALARFGIFHAGMESARDPKYTVEPQRKRVEQRGGTAKVS